MYQKENSNTHPDMDWLSEQGFNPEDYYHTEPVPHKDGKIVFRLKVDAPVKFTKIGSDRLKLPANHQYQVIQSSNPEGEPRYTVKDIETGAEHEVTHFEVELDRDRIKKGKYDNSCSQNPDKPEYHAD